MHVSSDKENMPEQGRPWSVKNGKLLFKGYEHSVKRLNLFKKNANLAEIQGIANKLNQEFNQGITKPKRIKVGGFFGKRFSVVPNELFMRHLNLAKKYNLTPEIINLAEPFTEDFYNQDAVEEFCQEVEKLPHGERAEILSKLTPWIENCEADDYKPTIVRELAKYSQELLQVAAPYAMKLCSGLEPNVDPAIMVVDAINSIPAEKREEVLSTAAPLLNSTSDWSKATVLKEIARLPDNSRQKVVDRTALVLREFPKIEPGLFFKALAPLSDEGFLQVQQHVLPFVQKQQGSGEQLFMFAALCELPLEDIDSVIQAAEPLLETAGLNIDTKKDLIKTVASFPASERKDAAALLKSILEPVNVDRNIILSQIRKLPNKEEKLSILTLAAPILKGKSDGDFISRIIYIVSTVPLQIRQEVVESATPFLVTLESIDEVISCLRIFQNLEASERDEIAAIVLSLFPQGSMPLDAIRWVNRLGAERQRVLELAHPFFNQFQARHQRLEILGALSTDLTEENMAAILPLLTEENVSSGDIAEQIRMLTQEASYDAVQSVKFRVSRQELEDSNNSLRFLDQLVTTLHANPNRQISVEFVGEPGIDASGLGREFIAKVVKGTIEHLFPKPPKDENGVEKLNPDLNKNGLVGTIQGNEKVTRQLGELMMFCLNAAQDYPIGMVFDNSVFAMVGRLKPYHFDRPLEELDKDEGKLQELVEMYVAIHGMTDSDDAKKNIERVRKFAAPFTEETDLAVLQDVYYSADCEFDEQYGLDAIADKVKSNPTVLKPHLGSLQKIARELVREMVEPDLVFARELALGMKASPFAQNGEMTFEKVQALGAKELAVRVQGELSAQIVLDKLEFEFAIPERRQNLVRDWIRGADKEKLERFVFALTGSYAVSQKPLRMHNGENIYFHTCFNSVNLPFFSRAGGKDIDDATFIGMMEGILAKIESTNRS